MRICYVVQRYGDDVGGGAEEAVRLFAEHLVARGHEVHVATTRAASYVDWADVYAEGDDERRGVRIHRFSIVRPRDPDTFGDLNLRLEHAHGPIALCVQYEWMALQGPRTPALVEWLRVHARSFDVVVCMTYLYWTTWASLRAIAGVVPTVLHPTAHAEPALGLSLFDEVFRLADALAYLTEEERVLLEARVGCAPRGEVVGIGVSTPAASAPAGSDAPYLCYVGRIDTAKGVDVLYRWFVAYKARHPGDLRLVLVGDPVLDVPSHPDVVVTGVVDTSTRTAWTARALALVQPSPYESFSLVLAEAFALGRPAIVNGANAVLAGHARRSGAAFAYHDTVELEAACELLCERPDLALRMGTAGRAYVQREYDWDVVLDRYERLLHDVAAGRPPPADRIG